MITKDKKYTTRKGLEVIILDIMQGYVFGRYRTSKLGEGENCDVEVWESCRWDDNGIFLSSKEESCLDLIEVSPYAHFKIDDKFLVWFKDYQKYKRHFAGLDSKGTPVFFDAGQTSWSSENGDTGTWPHFEPFIED